MIAFEPDSNTMIAFEPDSPWVIGQVVTLRYKDKLVGYKVVKAIEHSDDGSETQYIMTDVFDIT